jgi:hypothetical protein
MQSEGYRENLKEVLNVLRTANENIYDSMVQILMQGEMKEWNNDVPVGEVHHFDFELFKNSSDTNIQLLVKVIEKVDETYHSIENINGIKMGEE